MKRIILLLFLLCLSACSSAPVAPEPPALTELPRTLEPNLQPTEPPQPTYTSQPTYTPLPTYTLLPTYTPAPTQVRPAGTIISPANAVNLRMLGSTGELSFGNYYVSPDWANIAVLQYAKDAESSQTLTLWDSAGLLNRELKLKTLVEDKPISRKESPNTRLLFLTQGRGLATLAFCHTCPQKMLTAIWMIDPFMEVDQIFPMDIGGVPVEFVTPDGGIVDEEPYTDGVAALDIQGIKLLSVVSGEVRSVPAPGFAGLALHPGGQLAAVYNQAGISVIDLYSEQVIQVIPKSENDRIWLGVYSPDGRYFASADDRNNIIRETTSYEVVQTIPYNGGYSRLAFSPDSSILAARGGENEIVLWDVLTGQRLFSFTGAEDCSFSPDGSLILIQKKTEFVLWGLP